VVARRRLVARRSSPSPPRRSSLVAVAVSASSLVAVAVSASSSRSSLGSSNLSIFVTINQTKKRRFSLFISLNFYRQPWKGVVKKRSVTDEEGGDEVMETWFVAAKIYCLRMHAVSVILFTSSSSIMASSHHLQSKGISDSEWHIKLTYEHRWNVDLGGIVTSFLAFYQG
ncbi:hypothetical protein Ccrd_010158, partial [Cynara cardunculus var. scolymus]